MKWITRGFVFAAALVIGTFAASVFWDVTRPEVATVSLLEPAKLVPGARYPVTAQHLLGTWKGTWGHNDGECTIVISRVDGNDFYGTLSKQGAVVRFEGTFDPRTRMFRFDETEVVRLGTHMTEWSLGKNSGIASQDGRILVGDGYDKWGQYGWAASNY